MDLTRVCGQERLQVRKTCSIRYQRYQTRNKRVAEMSEAKQNT